MIRIDTTLAIPESELQFTTSRSSGPGGQHVNKVESRVTLCFDVASSPSLSETQKHRLAERLRTRITRSGVLQMHSQRHRSQARNRAELVERFAALIGEALRRRRVRKKTRPSAGAAERRIEDKKRHGALKKRRTIAAGEAD